MFKIIAESKQLQEAQELFELFQSDYIPLQRCSEELLYLKSLWDMVRATLRSGSRYADVYLDLDTQT